MANRTRVGRVVAVLAAAVAAAAVTTPGSATAAAKAPDGHRVINYAGQCLDISASSPQDGAQLVQNHCTGAGSQNFSFESGSLYDQQVQTFTGKCWDVPGARPHYGVVQYYCNGAVNQRFRFIPTGGWKYEIRTLGNWCLTAIDGTVPGTRIHLYPCTGELTQQFTVS
ncbi:RICIN domain-containing protein [Streptomyces sp. NPDC056255]|uniref:RICIN domain-containing protein n=1 Tax=Streptomyces sp. NPDC056255 TaxID=3345764 RepID=UPI0035DD38E0